MEETWAIVDSRGVVHRGTQLDMADMWRKITQEKIEPDPRHKGDYYLVQVHAISHTVRGRDKWTLIDNDSMRVLPFRSEKKLRKYARDNGMEIKRSPTDPYGFYTVSSTFVPGNR